MGRRTWGRGDVGRGDAGTWGRRDAGTWGRVVLNFYLYSLRKVRCCIV